MEFQSHAKKTKNPAVDPQIVHIKNKMLQSNVKMGSEFFQFVTISQNVQYSATQCQTSYAFPLSKDLNTASLPENTK